MDDYLSAHRIHLFSGSVEEGNATQIASSRHLVTESLELMKAVASRRHGQVLDETEDGLTIGYGQVEDAIQAALEIQRKLDAVTAHGDMKILCLASIGIAWKINPFTHQKEEIRSKDLASFIAEAASAGEIFISEGVFDSIKDPSRLDCRFARQLIRVGEEKALNIYEIFWNHSEVELNKLQQDPNIIDLDIQPIRSFGLKLAGSILFLFLAVLMLTIGFDSTWAYLTKLWYR